MRAVVLSLVMLAGCGPNHPTAYEALKSWPSEKPVAIVVDDGAVSQKEFVAYWKRHPEKTREEIVEDLKVREALVQRALSERRGGPNSHDTVRKRGLVLALLKRDVESVSVPPVEDTFRYKKLLSRPSGYRVSNLVVRPATNADSADDPHLRVVADTMRSALGDEPTALDFVKLQQTPVAGVRVNVDLHLVFPTPADSALSPPATWRQVDDDFAQAVDDGFRSGKRVTGPFKTRFGWHIVLLEETLPGVRADEATVDELARRVALTEAQKSKLTEIVGEELKSQNWAMYPDAVGKEQE